MAIETFQFSSLEDDAAQFSFEGYAYLIEIRVKQYYSFLGNFNDGSFVNLLYLHLAEDRDGQTFWNDISRRFRYPKSQLIVPPYERVNRISVSGKNGITGEIDIHTRTDESGEQIGEIDASTSAKILIISEGSSDVLVQQISGTGTYQINEQVVAPGVFYQRGYLHEDKILEFPSGAGVFAIQLVGPPTDPPLGFASAPVPVPGGHELGYRWAEDRVSQGGGWRVKFDNTPAGDYQLHIIDGPVNTEFNLYLNNNPGPTFTTDGNGEAYFYRTATAGQEWKPRQDVGFFKAKITQIEPGYIQ